LSCVSRGITTRQADVIAWRVRATVTDRQPCLRLMLFAVMETVGASDRVKKEHKKKPGIPSLYVRCQVLIASAAVNQTATWCKVFVLIVFQVR